MGINQPLTNGNNYFWCAACDLRLPLASLAETLGEGKLCAKCKQEGYRLKETVIAYKPNTRPNIIKQEKEK